MPKPELLSQNELKEIRIDVEHNRLDYPHQTAKLLLDHIDAQAALLAERDAEIARLRDRTAAELYSDSIMAAHRELGGNGSVTLFAPQQEQPHAD